MTDDLHRRAAQARDAIEREAREVADEMPSPSYLGHRAARRRATRRGVALLGAVALGSLMMRTSIWGGEPRSTVTASAPKAPRTGSSLPPEEAVTTPTAATAGTETTPTTRPRATSTSRAAPTTTTTSSPKPSGASAGVWVVGVDGTGLRRVADAGLAAWSPDQQSVAVASGNGVTIVSVADGHVEGTIQFHPGNGVGTVCLDWSARDRLAWVTTDAPGGKDLGTVWMAGAHDSEAQSVDTDRLDAATPVWRLGPLCDWSPDGSQLAVGGKNVRLYGSDGGVVSTTPLDSTISSVGGMAWSPDGSLVAGIAVPKLEGSQRDGDQLWVKALTAEPRLWPSPTGGPVVRMVWAHGRPSLYLRVGGRNAGQVDEQPGAGIYSLDVETGKSTQLSSSYIMALQALPDDRLVGLTSEVSAADTVEAFDTQGAPQGVVTRADPHYPENWVCAGSYFSALAVSPRGDHLLLTAQSRYVTEWCDYSPPL